MISWARKQGGLTLLELMVAMSIFSVLGVMLFMFMRGTLDMYRTSRSSGEYYDKFDQLMRPLVDDLSCVYIGDPEGLGPKVQFRLNHERQYVPPKGVELSAAQMRAYDFAPGDPRSFLLRFVRTFPGGEMQDNLGRFAGTYEGAEAYIDGVGDEAESHAAAIRDGKLGAQQAASRKQLPGLKAPGNLMEVMYFFDRGEHDLPGTYTLYRAVQSPIGGPQSFFLESTLKAMTPDWIAQHAKAVVSGIAYFGLTCWGQDTEEWAMDAVLDARLGGRKKRSNQNASYAVWDSTRAIDDAFGFHRGLASARDWSDDVFPSQIKFSATFVEEGKVLPEARLVGELKGANRQMQISSERAIEELGDERTLYLKIEDEWMKVTDRSGRTLSVDRGARRTSPKDHPGGADIIVGRTFRKSFALPAHRFYYGPQGMEAGK